MSPMADVIVYFPRRVLTVECRGGKGKSKEYAALLRQSLLTHQFIDEDSYFLLVLSNALYLWPQGSPADSEPEFSADTKSALEPYLGRLLDQPGGPRRESLQLGVSSWLHDLAVGLRKPDPQIESDRMLLISGLYDCMRGGFVETGVDE